MCVLLHLRVEFRYLITVSTARPKQICPITGKLAKYLDPRTGVPYADVRAYDVLTGILRHEFVWSPGLGCYIGKEEAEGMTV